MWVRPDERWRNANTTLGKGDAEAPRVASGGGIVITVFAVLILFVIAASVITTRVLLLPSFRLSWPLCFSSGFRGAVGEWGVGCRENG
jgi:hypothetical protein